MVSVDYFKTGWFCAIGIYVFECKINYISSERGMTPVINFSSLDGYYDNAVEGPKIMPSVFHFYIPLTCSAWSEFGSWTNIVKMCL